MEEEIVAGLRNAVSRGEPLETAVQSFINAGYNPQEVRAAATNVSGGASQVVFGSGSQEKSILRSPSLFSNKKKNRKYWLVGGIVVVLLIFLATISYLIYRVGFS